jgi:hypothetical protein
MALMKSEKTIIFGATGKAGHAICYYQKSFDCYEVIDVVSRYKLTY